MNKTEDYLDSLLSDVSAEKKAETEKKKRGKINTDFIEEFENELNDADMEDFIRDFEIEVDTEDDIDYSEVTEDTFFDNLEGIVKKAKENSSTQQTNEEESFEVNTLEEDAWAGEEERASEAQTEEAEETQAENISRSPEEQELLDMLADLPSDEELSNLGEMLRTDNGNMGSEVSDETTSIELSDITGDGADSAENPKGKKEKKGFFKKLATILFGDDEDDLAKDGAANKDAAMPAESAEISNISEENLQILQELDAAEKAGKDSEPEEESKKGKKGKKAKKEKKPKEKKEKKEKKPKEPKPKKEPKPRKPKEVDLTPPLPKKPVILIFVMGISGVLFVMLASNLLGYSVSISDAKKAYASESYVEAYHNIAGLEVKEQDAEFYERVLLLAKVQGELENGNALYESKEYKMALDSYISALGRYHANYEDAITYDIKEEYDALAEKIITQLAEKFGVSAEAASELYGMRNRADYTCEIYNIVKALGLIE